VGHQGTAVKSYVLGSGRGDGRMYRRARHLRRQPAATPYVPHCHRCVPDIRRRRCRLQACGLSDRVRGLAAARRKGRQIGPEWPWRIVPARVRGQHVPARVQQELGIRAALEAVRNAHVPLDHALRELSCFQRDRLWHRLWENLVHRKGFEPLAPRFEVWCSIQLSYRCEGASLGSAREKATRAAPSLGNLNNLSFVRALRSAPIEPKFASAAHAQPGKNKEKRTRLRP
jgi:hypothetical protein